MKNKYEISEAVETHYKLKASHSIVCACYNEWEKPVKNSNQAPERS